MQNSEKRYIPGTNPSWGRELPDNDDNSLVDKNGQNWDNGYNFDEPDRDKLDHESPTRPETSFEDLAEERKLAEYTKDQIIYAGLFVDPTYLYDKFPPTLAHRIRDPHVTTAFRPGVEKLLLGSLGSNADIRAVGYGNDGQNEGLLVEVTADDPAVQKIIDERIEPDETGKLRSFPVHITLSIADNAKAVNTRNLDFRPLPTPVDLTGVYQLFCKDGTLIADKETIRKMQESGSTPGEVNPDRL